MANKKKFDAAAQQNSERLSQKSIFEVAVKIERLKDFYEDPYHDGSERWYMAEYCLDYLCNYKTEGTKRKDGVTENILHEINQLILHKSLAETNRYTANEPVLPCEVTYKIVDGGKINIPKAENSMERLFCAIAIHDVDEDFLESSIEEFKNYIKDKIKSENDLSDNDRKKLLLELEVDCRSMEKLTFGRKALDDDNKKIKIETFNGDRNLYMDALENSWITIAMKVVDRLDSLTSRYGKVNDYFSINSDISHIDETNRLFRIRHTLENMADKYPEMSEYFDLIRAKLHVASKCLECITLYHPSKLSLDTDGSIFPETAQIDITRPLEYAVKYSEYLDEDSWMLERMMSGFENEAINHPELANIIGQMRDQYDNALQNHFKAVRDNAFELYDELRGDRKLGDDINPDLQ